MRHPPTSSLFPYTTLFRSDERHVLDVVEGRHIGIARQRADFALDRKFTDALDQPVAHLPVGDQDRKSTRLNSSHVAISYAVFCLKKKKKQKYLNTYLNTSN